MKIKRLPLIALPICLATLFIVNSCKKEPAPPVETCYDGIQNQGETGVDCGGPCTACYSVLCDGKGDTSWMPMVLNNKWTYDLSAAAYDRTLTADSMVTFGTRTYFRLKMEESTTTSYLYYRDSANAIYEYVESEGKDFMVVPANPVPSQTVAVYSGTATVTQLRVVTANAQVATSSCTYKNCVQIGRYNSGGTLESSIYFKKGIGLVRENYVTFADLKAVTLN